MAKNRKRVKENVFIEQYSTRESRSIVHLRKGGIGTMQISLLCDNDCKPRSDVLLRFDSTRYAEPITATSKRTESDGNLTVSAEDLAPFVAGLVAVLKEAVSSGMIPPELAEVV